MSKLDLGLRIVQMLADLGIKPGTFLGKASNVKKAFTGGKPTFFKPDVLETLRSQDGNFSDALKLMEDEAKYITNATDAEKMAFLNNLSQYKSLGGPPKVKTTKELNQQAKDLGLEFKGLKGQAEDIKTETEGLMGLAKTMKEDAEKNLAKSKKDLDDLLTTGGQPFKAKDNKFLGGSMHEEGQIRTGIRQFLQNEYKNGRLKLDELDAERVMKYSPMIEHDPILVFKKIYGDEAYNKAGSFPGAFEKGENYNHYEQIFRENMGEDILKVKNEKYKGDGTLVLTEMEEIKPPTPDDPDIPFATGGRAGYGLGNLVKGRSAVAVPGSTPVSSGSGNGLGGLLANFVTSNPQIFNNAQKTQSTPVSNTPVSTNVNQNIPAVDARMNLDYDTLINQNEAQRNLQAQRRNKLMMLKDVNQVGMPRETTQDDIDTFNFNMSDPMMTGFDYSKEINWSPGQPAPDGYRIAEIMGDKFLERMYPSKQEIAGLPGMIGPMPLGLMMPPSGDYRDLYREDPDAGLSGQEYAEKYGLEYAKGGRAGYYTGGMIDVEPNLSDIGHGSDSLMARTRLVAPDSQATTSTGLNYLLAEDNDNIRVPFDDGKIVKRRKGEMGPSFETNDPKEAIKEVIRRLINVDPAKIPLSDKMQLMFDLNRAKAGGVTDLFGGELDFGINKGFGRDDTSIGFNFKKSFAEGGRIGFSKGKLAKEVLDKGRRGFMKAAGAGAAGLAALKTGLLGFGEKAAPVVETAVEAAKGVPPYFFQLVDVIKSKGREIKSYGERVRQYIAPSKDGKSELMLTEDLSTGDIQVKKIHKEGDEMVTKSEEMNFTKGRGDETTQGTPADDYEEITEYNSRIYKDEFNDPDYVEGIDVDEIVKEIDVKKTKKADGGRIGFESGKVVLAKKIYELLKNNKKIKEAVDNIFSTGDYKYDASMAAESLVELNPKAFGNKLYDDLDQATQMEVYDAVISPIMANQAKALRMKKASKPTKTLEGIEKTGTINISDPEVAEEFARFMKETSPGDAKKVEQTVELSNFNPKGRKKNATGGLTSMLGE